MVNAEAHYSAEQCKNPGLGRGGDALILECPCDDKSEDYNRNDGSDEVIGKAVADLQPTRFTNYIGTRFVIRHGIRRSVACARMNRSSGNYRSYSQPSFEGDPCKDRTLQRYPLGDGGGLKKR